MNILSILSEVYSAVLWKFSILPQIFNSHSLFHMYHSQIQIWETYIECSQHIYIEHRNPETRKTRNDFLVQVRNFLLPLSLKVLRHKERDTHSFYSGFSICLPPNTCGTRYKCTCLASASKRKSPFFFGRQDSTQLTDFFKIPQILRALPVRDVTRTL